MDFIFRLSDWIILNSFLSFLKNWDRKNILTLTAWIDLALISHPLVTQLKSWSLHLGVKVTDLITWLTQRLKRELPARYLKTRRKLCIVKKAHVKTWYSRLQRSLTNNGTKKVVWDVNSFDKVQKVQFAWIVVKTL